MSRSTTARRTYASPVFFERGDDPAVLELVERHAERGQQLGPGAGGAIDAPPTAAIEVVLIVAEVVPIVADDHRQANERVRRRLAVPLEQLAVARVPQRGDGLVVGRGHLQPEAVGRAREHAGVRGYLERVAGGGVVDGHQGVVRADEAEPVVVDPHPGAGEALLDVEATPRDGSVGIGGEIEVDAGGQVAHEGGLDLVVADLLPHDAGAPGRALGATHLVDGGDLGALQIEDPQLAGVGEGEDRPGAGRLARERVREHDVR
ncbi:hypothetical protein [Nannocystis pusilla]|uniref:hypothetical protein n=1 Tax=Nannocystis pusilla TaxID=889268 RepID=UPI003DA4086B